jgi:hypothetical protein
MYAQFSIHFAIRYPRPQNHTAAVSGDVIYVIGGTDCPYSMEALDTKTRTWSKLPDVPSRCRASAACSHNGFIYVYGGFDADLKVESNNRFCTFNCTTGHWLEALTNYDFRPHCKRSHHTLTECNGLLVAVGGLNGYRSISDTEYVVMAPHSASNSTAATEETPAASQMMNHDAPLEILLIDPVLTAVAAASPSSGPIHEVEATSEASAGYSPAATVSLPQTAITEVSAPSSRVLSLKERLSGALASSKAVLGTVLVASSPALAVASMKTPCETTESSHTSVLASSVAQNSSNRFLEKLAAAKAGKVKTA